jgi:hypothetical protein
LRENVFNYIPLTFLVEIDINKTKMFAKAMVPFFNSFYALEDNKKKVVRYFEKLNEIDIGRSSITKSTGSLPLLESGIKALDIPADEAFIFKHFYNNQKGLIK